MAGMKTLQELYLNHIPCGVWLDGEDLVIIFESPSRNCGVVWYDTRGRETERIYFQEQQRSGNRHIMVLPYKKYKNASYMFLEDEKLLLDENAKVLTVPDAYGVQWSGEELRAGIPDCSFRWGKDRAPGLSYADSVIYLAHVRGFTAHKSSQVTYPGTFSGMREKIPYLKELGVTTLELQPVYEFPEYPLKEEYEKLQQTSYFLPPDKCPDNYLNYWGYKKGFYFLPKRAYSHGNPSSELKELIKALHANHMEVILQFYFPAEVKKKDIPFILEYWVAEYHVDGFHLMGENLPIAQIGETACLKDIKFWYGNPDEVCAEKETIGSYENWAGYNSEYMYAMRRFLRGDEHVLEKALDFMKYIPDGMGQINYMTNYFGMTMMDMVSYDRKHNEANGEGNRDGDDFNCSFNCGEEGPSRKKKVLQLRSRQIKNALSLLFLSQGTPLLFMGDEMGHSQQGNNNPYCLDNEITWLNWELSEKNKEIHDFCRDMIALRLAHPILHPQARTKGLDSRSCGYPDLSCHGEKAWQPDFMYYNRHIGMLYCGAPHMGSKDSVFYYIAVNLHWEEHKLALPKLPRGLKWQCVQSTGAVELSAVEGEYLTLEGRTICVYTSVEAKKGTR